tara:strand:- start:465 stop:734 length:270 start_codon:yes stop_codon:yes gene_type:complete
MSIFRENPAYLEEILDDMIAKKVLYTNKLGELATDIEEKLAEDYGNEDGSFDIDGWETDNEGEIIAFDIGYRNACLNAVKIINKLTKES